MPYSSGGGSSDGGFSPGDYDYSSGSGFSPGDYNSRPDYDYRNSSASPDKPYHCYSYINWRGNRKYFYARENPRYTRPVSLLFRII